MLQAELYLEHCRNNLQCMEWMTVDQDFWLAFEIPHLYFTMDLFI